MSRVVFLNGEYKDYNYALTHVEDRGYQFADGVYEVFSVKNGKLIDLSNLAICKNIKNFRIITCVNKRT